ncbi:hypothetical protein DBR32_11415 [Taibaiella sp. KBW10]|uniref:hypothetical protein n=1 Tax=Taibaiella sp. KBW10 TaxID=2153357 RepID=UPI000F5B2723|nr:hypothetical protein [Taibaiella sp. KBW10]RQO30184.1 hypothetical protein DBR32_11415 [Taibaiella sp. KBW10]
MKKILNLLVCCFALWAPQQAAAQKLSGSELQQFQKTEDSLIISADSMYRAYMYEERIDYCHKFVKQLSALLKRENSFSYPFERLGKKIHILYPEDKSFRIFNWTVEYKIAGFRYYGAVQKSEGPVFPLLDMSEKMEDNLLYKPLSNKNWFGCEYYRILTQKGANGQPLYFVFGSNHNGNGYSVKTMDLLGFSGNQVTFGGNYFNTNNRQAQRFMLEYQKGSQVSLNLDSAKNMIIYDRLISEVNQPQRRNTLVPSGQVDGLRWVNFQWQTVEDVVPIMKLKNGQAPVNGVIPNQ